MAYTYENTPVLSRIRIGANDYYLKDADVRQILDTFNNAIVTGTVGTVNDNNDSFVKSKDIKSYVDDLVAIGLVIEVVTTLPTASASTMGKIYLMADAHGTGDNYDEYITVRTGSEGSYTYAWEKIGNTDIDLSKYVTNISYSGTTLSQTKNGATTTVHTFGSLADKSSVSGTVSVPTSGSVTITPTGSLTKDATNGTQISGSISSITVINSVGSLPSKAADSFTANTPTTIDTTKFNGGTAASLGSGFYTAGKAASFTEGTFTANTPTKIDVTKFSGGSMTGGSYTAPVYTEPYLNTAALSFATAGVTANVGSGDDAETLILSKAITATAYTSINLVPGSITSGSVTFPTFTAASLGNGFYTAGTAASKTADSFTPNTVTTIDTSKFNGGTAASLGTGFYTKGSAASFTEGTFSKGSLPTTKTVTPTFTGDKFSFSGDEGTATVSLTNTDKTVTSK